MNGTVETLDELVARIPDGASVAVPPDYSGCAMAAVRALIREGVRRLELICVPQAGFQADMLIGAGCVGEIETSAVTLGEHGQAPRFREAVSQGRITMRDSTCPAIHAGLQAAEKGVPFMPLRGILGSDIHAHRDDWRVIDNPFGDGDPIVLLPAIRPDVALFHAPLADRDGNVWIGVRRELMTMAHASAAARSSPSRRSPTTTCSPTSARRPARSPRSTSRRSRRRRREPGRSGCTAAIQPTTTICAATRSCARTAEGFERYLEEHVLSVTAA